MFRLSPPILFWILLTAGLSPMCRGQATAPLETSQDDPRRAEIESFFDSVNEAFATDPQAVLQLVSREHLTARAARRGLANPDQLNDGKVADELADALRQASEVWFSGFTSDQYDILELKFVGDDQAEAYLRHWDDGQEIYSKYRWWLIRTDQGWKVSDVRDVEYNLQASSILASVSQAARNNEPWVAELAATASALLEALATDDEAISFDSVQDEIDTLLNRKIPDDLRAWALSLKINWLLDQEDSAEETLDLIHEMENLEGDYPAVHFLRGQVLVSTADYQQALESFQKYADRFGWDADICEFMADTCYSMDDLPRSVEFAEKGLTDKPQSWGCLASLAVALPTDQKSKLDRYLDNLNNEESLLEYLIDWSIQMSDMEAARHVYAVLVQKHPDSELIAHYQEILDQSP